MLICGNLIPNFFQLFCINFELQYSNSYIKFYHEKIRIDEITDEVKKFENIDDLDTIYKQLINNLDRCKKIIFEIN